MTDDFNRSDSDNPGGNWTEVDGDADIISGELRLYGETIVATVAETFDDDPSMRVNFTIPDPQPGDIYRVLFNYKSSSTYYYGEVEYGATTKTIRLGEATDTVIQEESGIPYTPGMEDTLNACRTLEGAYIGTNASYTVWDCISDNDGRKAGIENPAASGSWEIDDFGFLRRTGMNGLGKVVQCFTCECECNGHCLPRELTLTVNATGACDCLDGLYCTLTYDPTYEPYFVWRGEIPGVPDWDCSVATGDMEFVLICEEEGQPFRLWTNGFPTLNGWGGTEPPPCSYDPDGDWPECSYIDYSEITCDPLEIVYTGLSNTGSPPCPPGGCTCNLGFTITE